MRPLNDSPLLRPVQPDLVELFNHGFQLHEVPPILRAHNGEEQTPRPFLNSHGS